MVTTSDAFTGENVRRGGFLDRAQRYERAAEVVAVTRALWDSRGEPVEHHGPQFDVTGRFPLPAGPQGHPVLIQAGDSPEDREFAATTADAIFTLCGSLEAGQAFYADVKGRLPQRGRSEQDLKVLPGVTFVLGDTDADAREEAVAIRCQQVSPQTAIAFLEQVWGRGLSGRQSFIGSPRTVAEQMDPFVQSDACDGFILVPRLTPGRLDRFVTDVVPEPQDRGSYRTAYPARPCVTTSACATRTRR